MEVSSGPGHSCDLGLAGGREADSGYYMCMLTQADTYHTRSVDSYPEMAQWSNAFTERVQ